MAGEHVDVGYSLFKLGVCWCLPSKKSVEAAVVDTCCWLTCEEIVGYSPFRVRLVAVEHSLPHCRGLEIVSHIILDETKQPRPLDYCTLFRQRAFILIYIPRKDLAGGELGKC